MLCSHAVWSATKRGDIRQRETKGLLYYTVVGSKQASLSLGSGGGLDALPVSRKFISRIEIDRILHTRKYSSISISKVLVAYIFGLSYIYVLY